MYLNFSELWRVGVVVREREREIRIRMVLVRGPGSTLGWDFLSF